MSERSETFLQTLSNLFLKKKNVKKTPYKQQTAPYRFRIAQKNTHFLTYFKESSVQFNLQLSNFGD